ncbi:hypothetical protein NE237_002384 [Protea cynaroides]|uniref:Uncharacterized protein n=1 Tax=Protea cynaroides TaxID=273540 RepID=A0A9Q0QZ07_9MAGN|nr:hypothetical protein NE237_002384 [Protea cynaroides]
MHPTQPTRPTSHQLEFFGVGGQPIPLPMTPPNPSQAMALLEPFPKPTPLVPPTPLDPPQATAPLAPPPNPTPLVPPIPPSPSPYVPDSVVVNQLPLPASLPLSLVPTHTMQTRSKLGISKMKTKFALDLFVKFRLLGSKPVVIPLEVNHKLSKEGGASLDDPQLHQEIVGILIYLTISCPDLSYPVGIVSQVMQDPRKTSMEVVKRILRYLKGTINEGVFYKHGINIKLSRHCDVDWAANPSTHRSISGFCFDLRSGSVSWANSGENINYKVPINSVSINQFYNVRSNPTFRARTKHIDVHYHFICEKILSKEIDLIYTPTVDEVTNIFTKALNSDKLKEFKTSLGMKHELRTERGCYDISD